MNYVCKMNKDLLLKDINALLEAINEEFIIISGQKGKIPEIEIDLIQNNVRLLYERLKQLSAANSTTAAKPAPFIPEKNLVNTDLITAAISTSMPEADTATIEAVKAHSKEISDDEKIIIATSRVTEKTDEKIKPAEAVLQVPESISAIDAGQGQEQAAIEAGKKEEAKNPKRATQIAGLFDPMPTVGQQFEDQTSVKDKITDGKATESVADKLNQNKISDLNAAIGINERFRFINELFEGNAQPYAEVIEKLNRTQDLNQAMQIIESYMSKYSWTKTNQSFVKFVKLVERKFQ